MKTVAELMGMIRSRSESSIEDQFAIDENLRVALWELSNAAHDGTELRAHVGTVEDERDQARENHNVLLLELSASTRLVRTFEAALLAVLKMRELT